MVVFPRFPVLSVRGLILNLRFSEAPAFKVSLGFGLFAFPPFFLEPLPRVFLCFWVVFCGGACFSVSSAAGGGVGCFCAFCFVWES